MISTEKLFGNIFSGDQITTVRLAAFCHDSLSRLTAGNQSDRFKSIINQITPALQNLQDELGDVDVSLTVQKGKTLTNNQVMASFKQAMREKEGVVADAIGGFDSTAYLEFYPHGLSEYTTANKTQMPVLVRRVSVAATKYAAQLGTELTATLQGFEQAWQITRKEQQQVKGSVDDSRTTRTDARREVETALIIAIHTVGAMFPGDTQQCSSFFDLNLLEAQTRTQKKEKFTGNITKQTTAVALNRSFSDGTRLKLTSVSDNASLLVFLGATADAQPNGSGVEIKPAKSRYLKLSELGDENDTFLIVKNLSDVNDASYLLEVKS